MENKISILVPVYKVEQYLERCIDSVVSQLFEGCELILVDDGSPDRCPLICDEYQKRYPNYIKVIHKKNGGLPSARLAGFEKAKGKYLVFLDSDDYLVHGSLRKLYETIEQGYDAVKGKVVREDLVSHEKWNENYEFDGRVITDNREYFRAVVTQKIPPYLHSGIYSKKLFKREYFLHLVNNGISLGEDWILNVAIAPDVKSFASIDSPCYCYCVNHSSMIYTSLYSYNKNDAVKDILYTLSSDFPEEYKKYIVCNRMSVYLKCFFTPELGYSRKHYLEVRSIMADKSCQKLIKMITDSRYLTFFYVEWAYYIYSKSFCFMYKCLKLKNKKRNVIQ